MFKNIIATSVLLLSTQLTYAQIDVVELDRAAMRGSIGVSRIYNPNGSELDAFITDCVDAEKSIEQKMRSVAANAGVSFDQLVVKKLIDYTWGNNGSVYSCDVFFLGKTSAKVYFETLYKVKNHLKKKGYKKSEFATACSDIEKEMASNPNEIFQSTGLGWTLFQGNRCGVRSILMTFKQ